MKNIGKIVGIFGLSCVLGFVSCNKFLNINTDPNKPTTQNPPSPGNILPQALTYVGYIVNVYNDYGSQVGGYTATAGGTGGFGSNWTYQFTSGDYNNLWWDASSNQKGPFDNIEDFQNIIDNVQGQPENQNYLAISKIMQSYLFQLLVDTYNDIPYSDAIKGANNVTPKYDSAATIYKSLADQIDSALAILNNQNGSEVDMSGVDVMFKGNITKWKQFANTLKLRILVRGWGKVNFSTQNKTFGSEGFLTDDALVNPGYARASGKQNPAWDEWVFTSAGSATTNSGFWLPSKFVVAFYDGGKLKDSWRGSKIYYQFPNVADNQMGFTDNSAPKPPSGGGPWYTGSSRSGTSAGNAQGIFKGPDMGEPIMLAAESYFLQAEANLVGIIGTPASVESNFDQGILASFKYIYKGPDNVVVGDPSGDVALYKAANSASYLVNYGLAANDDQRLEAIITQKWIALNYIQSDQGWNDYRRTGYPKIVNGSTDPIKSFASLLSVSTRPDKLPTRLPYPGSEASYNSANMPRGINVFSSLIFWAK